MNTYEKIFDTVYPVIIKVPESVRGCRGKEFTNGLSDFSKTVLKKSLKLSNLVLTEFEKDENGAPKPKNNVYWSVSHKPSYAAAVCAKRPIGIDIEELIPRSKALFEKIGSPFEWDLFSARTWENFFKLFTAKEALLKMAGVGLKDLSKCRVKEVLDPYNLKLEYLDRCYNITNFRFSNYIVSVTSAKKSVRWEIFK